MALCTRDVVQPSVPAPVEAKATDKESSRETRVARRRPLQKSSRLVVEESIRFGSDSQTPNEWTQAFHVKRASSDLEHHLLTPHKGAYPHASHFITPSTSSSRRPTRDTQRPANSGPAAAILQRAATGALGVSRVTCIRVGGAGKAVQPVLAGARPRALCNAPALPSLTSGTSPFNACSTVCTN
ncbi:hypothetical protein MRX96_015175 [Rhipicephalus microplus]